MVFVAIVSQGAPGNEGRDIPALRHTMLVDGNVAIADMIAMATENYSPVLMIEVSRPLVSEKLYREKKVKP